MVREAVEREADEMSQDQSTSVTIADLKQRWKRTLGMRREQYSTMLKSCQETKPMFEELRAVLNQNLPMDELTRGQFRLNAMTAVWTLNMSELVTGYLNMDNDLFEIVLTDSLDLLNTLDLVGKELAVIRQGYGETKDAKRKLEALNKKAVSQTRKYGKVLRFLEAISEKAEEQQRKLQKELSYVE